MMMYVYVRLNLDHMAPTTLVAMANNIAESIDAEYCSELRDNELIPLWRNIIEYLRLSAGQTFVSENIWVPRL